MSENQIVVYHPNETVRLDVRLENETVWLNRHQMAQLFGRDVKTVGKHVANALKEELSDLVATEHSHGETSLSVVAKSAKTRKGNVFPTVAKFATVQNEGGRQIVRQVEYYNLDVILSVGYRVKSPQGILFRRWANTVLKEYLLHGYSFNTRLNQLEDKMDRRLAKHDQGSKGSDPSVYVLLYKLVFVSGNRHRARHFPRQFWLSQNLRQLI